MHRTDTFHATNRWGFPPEPTTLPAPPSGWRFWGVSISLGILTAVGSAAVIAGLIALAALAGGHAAPAGGGG